MSELIENKSAEIVDNIPKLQLKTDDQRTYAEQAKDVVGVMATQSAIQDEALVQKVAEKKKEELLNAAEATLKKEKAENKSADTELQKANYGVYQGVANYAGIAKPLPQKMQNVLFVMLSVIQTIFLIIFGVPTSIFNIIADCIDAIIAKLSNIAKSSRWCILILFFVFILALGAYVILSLLKKYNIIQGVI